MSEFLLNYDTNTDVFYHGSKNGIIGKISPSSRSNCDFGTGFYIGTKYAQAVDIASLGTSPSIYEIKIPAEVFTKENTLFLTKEDWMLYTLYNRGKLEKIKNTPLYNYYSTLDKDKQFVIGAIVDDSYRDCMEAYLYRGLTDNGYYELVDCFNYGVQIVAKTQEACDKLVVVKDKTHKMNDYEKTKARRYSNRIKDEGYGKFVELYGKYEYIEGISFRKLCKMAENGYIPDSYLEEDVLMGYNNIEFPGMLHTKGDKEYEPFG